MKFGTSASTVLARQIAGRLSILCLTGKYLDGQVGRAIDERSTLIGETP